VPPNVSDSFGNNFRGQSLRQNSNVGFIRLFEFSRDLRGIFATLLSPVKERFDMADETKNRILDAAEALFAAGGFDGTSLRKVTGVAEVNLAAVNYHFGNKEGLLHAVLARRIAPVNQERLQRLDALEAEDRTPSLEEVTRAFVLPALDRHSDERGRLFARRLLGRFFSEQGSEWLPVFLEQFREVKERFGLAFHNCLPHLSVVEVAWRMHFAIGAMAHAMADECRLDALSGGACDPRDAKTLRRELVTFIVGGLRAPSHSGATLEETASRADEEERR